MHHDFYLADWLVQPSQYRLVKPETTVRLTDRTMRALIRLSGAPGEIVTRGELFEAVWPDTIVSDDSLFRTIADLRHALGDDAKQPVYIETIRHVGYRLVAPIHVGDGMSAGPQPVLADPPEWQTLPLTVPQTGVSRSYWALAVAASVLLLAAAVLWIRSPAASGPSAVPAMPVTWTVQPLTSHVALEAEPALSPDGQLVAFIRYFGTEEADLFVQRLDADVATQVSQREGTEADPAWSPDGSHLAFGRYREGRLSLNVMPVVGGAERPVKEWACAACELGGLSWGRDETELVYSFREAGQRFSMYRLDLGTGASTVLTTPPGDLLGDLQPVWNPATSALAFIRGETLAEFSAGLRPVIGRVVVQENGEERAVTPAGWEVLGLSWLHEKHLLVMARTAAGRPSRLFEVDVATQDIEPVVLPVAGFNRRVSAHQNRLVYETWAARIELWDVPLDAGNPTVSATPRLMSTRADYSGRYSPSEERIAFVSTRSGTPELWLSDSDGAVRHTAFGHGEVRGPLWSNDGARIAFVHASTDLHTLYVAEAHGRAQQALWQTPGEIRAANFALDGKSILASARVDGAWDVWRVPLDGSKPAPYGIEDGHIAAELAGGDLLLTLHGQNGLYRWSPRGDGVPVRLHAFPHAMDWPNWKIAGGRIFVLRHGEQGQAGIDVLSLSGQLQRFIDLPGLDIPVGSLSFEVNSTGTQALLSVRTGTSSDLVWGTVEEE